jgi:hypothetical protein
MMHGHEKSSSAIVAVKPTNKVARPAAEQSAAEPAAAELVEPRAEAKGKVGQQRTHRAQYRVRVAQTLARIRQAIAVVTRGGNRMRESCKYGSQKVLELVKREELKTSNYSFVVSFPSWMRPVRIM